MVRNRAREVYLKLVHDRISAIYDLFVGDNEVSPEELAERVRKTPKRKFGVRNLAFVRNHPEVRQYMDGCVYDALLEKGQGLLFYNDEDDRFIDKHRQKGLIWITRVLGVSKSSIRNRAGRSENIYYIKKEGAWTDEDDQYLRDHPNKDKKELAGILDRTDKAIRRRRTDLGVRHRKKWNDKEIEWLYRCLDAKVPYKRMCEILDVTKSQLNSYVSYLKKKDGEMDSRV